MATDTVTEYNLLMRKATEYHGQALWQEKLRVLQHALELCREEGFPEAEHRRQEVLYEMGGIRRRFGQHEEGARTLKDALEANPHASLVMRATILGELGVIYRHSNDYALAQRTFQDQYELAYHMSVEADAQLCRAIGNEGMSNFNLFQQTERRDTRLLEAAIEQLKERIDRAEKLYDRLSLRQPDSKYVQQSCTWKAIGMDRLSLCYTSAGEMQRAVDTAKASQEFQQRIGNQDPTIRGYSRYFYGHALWHHGEREAALQQWNAPLGECNSPISLCKEPAAEHVEYLRLMAEAGVEFDTFDEQGFSPLDYAKLSDNPDARHMVDVIVGVFQESLRKEFERCIPRLSAQEITERGREEIENRLQVANIRRYYRAILQEYIRPALRSQAVNPIPELRRIYSDLLAKDEGMRAILDSFYFVTYEDFREHKRLPTSDARRPGSKEKLVRQFSNESGDLLGNDNLFIVFFSYRWIGMSSSPSLEGPDDEHDTQYDRMLNAIETLVKRRNLDPRNVGIWLDCTCINQLQTQQRERGINSLPLAVTQCDAMISLVDETYYTRAWCAVEVTLVRELLQAYQYHKWYEHVLHSPQTDRLRGVLREGNLRSKLEVKNLKLTKEGLDRPKIDFLIRQSKLLGRDDAF